MAKSQLLGYLATGPAKRAKPDRSTARLPILLFSGLPLASTLRGASSASSQQIYYRGATMKTAVVISTYNNPEPLRKTLLGFLAQTYTDFAILVADDGSDDRVRGLLAEPIFDPLPIQHVWHEDRGFRLSAIRNRAIAQSTAEYLIFCDADCVPRDDYVESHIRHARPNYFIAGARVNIPAAVHQTFSDEEILSQRIFDAGFLAGKRAALKRYRWRLSRGSRWESCLNWLTFRYCVFSGSNSSAWRDDLLAVNGFDESFTGYGSEDRDIGIRLHNNGVRSRYLKFSLVQMHLDHPQSYLDPVVAAENRRRFRARKTDRTTRIAVGVDTVTARA